MIPSIYWENLKTVVQHHPKWQYYFWSDNSARKLIADRHPYLLKTYDSYPKGIQRGDALRYVVLYEFGGVYMDMDYEVLRPLDRATMKYANIIAPEVFEHTALLFNMDFLLMNCIMFSRPKHPFMKRLIEQLIVVGYSNNVLHSTGPMFLTKQYKLFYNITDGDRNKTKTDCSSSSPYFYKGELLEEDNNAVYVPNTHYFNDDIDLTGTYEKKFPNICKQIHELPLLKQRACFEMNRLGLRRYNSTFRITKHKWSHIYDVDISKMKLMNITELIPNMSIYK